MCNVNPMEALSRSADPLNLFNIGGDKKESTPAAAPVAAPTTASPSAVNAQQTQRRTVARGRASTILTGGQGDLEPTPTGAARLLGA